MLMMMLMMMVMTMEVMMMAMTMVMATVVMATVVRIVSNCFGLTPPPQSHKKREFAPTTAYVEQAAKRCRSLDVEQSLMLATASL